MRSALRTDCTRRQGLKREASETRCAQTADASLSVSGPGDASPSNGDPRQRPLQLQLSLRGQRQLQLPLRGQEREVANPTCYSNLSSVIGKLRTRRPVA